MFHPLSYSLSLKSGVPLSFFELLKLRVAFPFWDIIYFYMQLLLAFLKQKATIIIIIVIIIMMMMIKKKKVRLLALQMSTLALQNYFKGRFICIFLDTFAH